MHRAEVFFFFFYKKAYLHHTCGFSEKDDTGFDDNHSAWKLRILCVAQDTELQAFVKCGNPKESLCLIQHHAT
jgi:hypothetical protein